MTISTRLVLGILFVARVLLASSGLRSELRAMIATSEIIVAGQHE